MSQEVHEQLSIVDQLFAELKRTYYAGHRPSYAQLKLIAPTLSLDDYKLLVQRFMDYMREQEVQTFKEQEHQLSQAYPYMPDHVTEDLLFFEQTVFSQFARFLVQRDQSIAATVAQDMEQQRKQLMFLTSENSLLKRENRKLQVQITALETSLSRLDESYQFECKAHQQAQIELNKLRESEGAGHLFVKLLKQHLDSPEIANISKSLSHSTAEALIALLRKSDGESKPYGSTSSESDQLAVSQAQVEYEALIDSSAHDNGKKDSKVSDTNLAESESLFYSNQSLTAASLHEDSELDNSLELPATELSTETSALHMGQSFKGVSGAEQPEFPSHDEYRKNLFMSSDLAKYRHIKVDDLVSLQQSHTVPAFTPNVPADVAVAPHLTQGLSSLPNSALKAPTAQSDPDSRLSDPLLLSQGTASIPINGLEESGAELDGIEDEDVAVDPVVVDEVRPIAPEEVESDSSEVKDSEQLNALNDAAQRLAQMAAPQLATNSEESIKAALAAIISSDPLVDEDEVVEDEATSIGAQALLKRKSQIEPTSVSPDMATIPAAVTSVAAGTTLAPFTIPPVSVALNASAMQAHEKQGQIASAESGDSATASTSTSQPLLGEEGASVLPAGMAGLVGASFSTYPELAALNQNLAQGRSTAQLLASLGTSSLAGWGMMTHMSSSAYDGASQQPDSPQGTPHDLSNPLELKIDELTALRDKLFADKDNEDVTSMEIEELVLAALEQKLFTPEQEGMCRRLVVKLMFLGRDAVYPQDATASSEEILRAIPNVEQRFFAQAALAWKEQTAFDSVLPQELADTADSVQPAQTPAPTTHEIAGTSEPAALQIDLVTPKVSAENALVSTEVEAEVATEQLTKTDTEEQPEAVSAPSSEIAETEPAVSEDSENRAEFADIVETKNTPAGFLADIPTSPNHRAVDRVEPETQENDTQESEQGSELDDTLQHVTTDETNSEADELASANETAESQEVAEQNDDAAADDIELQDESDKASTERNCKSSGGLVFSMLSDDNDESTDQAGSEERGEILTFTMESEGDDEALEQTEQESESAERNTFRLDDEQPEQEEILSFEAETGGKSGGKGVEPAEQPKLSETETETELSEIEIDQSGADPLNVTAPAPHCLLNTTDLSISNAPMDMAAFMAMLQQPATIEPSKSSASIPTPVVPKSNLVADVVNSFKPSVDKAQVESATTNNNNNNNTITSEYTETTQAHSSKAGAPESTADLEVVTQDQARMWLAAAGLVKEDNSEQDSAATSIADIIKSGAPDTPSISSETSANLANTAISATPQPAVPIDIMGSDQQFAKELASEMVSVEQAQVLGKGSESGESIAATTTTTTSDSTDGVAVQTKGEAAAETVTEPPTETTSATSLETEASSLASPDTVTVAGGEGTPESENLETAVGVAKVAKTSAPSETEAVSESFSASFPPAKLINRIPRSLVRDESTLVKEISSPSGDDSIAAFAAATAKVESLAPLLNETKLEGATTDALDSESTHSAVNGVRVGQQDVLATSELAQVAQDVLKVANELEAKSQQAKAQSSIFDRYYGDIDLEKAKQQAQEYQDKEGDDFVSGNIRSEDEHQPTHMSSDLGEYAIGTLPREIRPYQQEQSTADAGSHGSVTVSDAESDHAGDAATGYRRSEQTHLGSTSGETSKTSLSSSAILVPDQPSSELKLETAASESDKHDNKPSIKWFDHDTNSSNNVSTEHSAVEDAAYEHVSALGKVDVAPHQTSFVSTGSGKSQDVVEHNLGAIEILHSADQGHTQVTKHGAAEVGQNDLPEIAVSLASQPQAIEQLETSAESHDSDLVTGNVNLATDNTSEASNVADTDEVTHPVKVELHESADAEGVSSDTAQSELSKTVGEPPAPHITSISTENTNIIISEPAPASGLEPTAEIVSKVESIADTVITEAASTKPEVFSKEAISSIDSELVSEVATAAQSEQAQAENQSQPETTVETSVETEATEAQAETSVSASESTAPADSAISDEATTGTAEEQSSVDAEAGGAGAETGADTQAAADSGEAIKAAEGTEVEPVAETLQPEVEQSETASSRAESSKTIESAAVVDSAEAKETTETVAEVNQEDWNGAQTAARKALNANELVKFELLYSEVKATYLAKEQELKEITARLGDSSVVTLDPKAIYLEVFNEVEHAHTDMLSPKLKAALSEQAEADFFPAQAALESGHNQSTAQNNVTSAQVLPSSLESVVTKAPVSILPAAVPVVTPAQDNLSQWGIPSNLKTEATKETDFQDLNAKSVDKHYPDEVTVDEEQVIAKFQSDADFKRESQEFNRELQGIAQQGTVNSGSGEIQGSPKSACTSSSLENDSAALGCVGSQSVSDHTGDVTQDGSIQVDLEHSTFMEPRADVSEKQDDNSAEPRASASAQSQVAHSVEHAPEKVLTIVDRNQELSLPVLNEQEEIEHVPTEISFDLEDSSLGSMGTALSSSGSSESKDDGMFSLALESELSFKAQVEIPKTNESSHIKWQTRDSVSDWESGLSKNSFTFNPFSQQDQDSLGSGDSGHVKDPFTPHTSKFSFDPLGRSGDGALNGGFKGGYPFVSSLNAAGKLGLGSTSARHADGGLEIAPSTKKYFGVSGGTSGALGAGAGVCSSSQGVGHGSSTSFSAVLGLGGGLGSSFNSSMITGATQQGVPTEVKLGADPKFSFGDFKGGTGIGLTPNKSAERKNARTPIKWQDHDN